MAGFHAAIEPLYAPSAAAEACRAATELARGLGRSRPDDRWNERDCWLIAYPDHVRAPGEVPLRSLRRLHDELLHPWVDGVHVLPFHPASSDRGFSVVDHAEVDPAFGTWDDVEALGHDGRTLMVDAVINHTSRHHRWFVDFCAGRPERADHYVVVDDPASLAGTARPRTGPPYTTATTAAGERLVWATFSADQVDLDYRSATVLTSVLGVLARYLRHGARAIRLDAIAYLWKQPGTPSIHLPETHRLVHAIRTFVDAAAPGTILITETNVPHADNVSYFGTDERPEAHAVYHFTLPPLVLDAVLGGDARRLTDWVDRLEPVTADRTYLNFASSHDGIGVWPAEPVLGTDGVDRLVRHCRDAGGLVGEREVDGAPRPYELNSTWFALMAAGVDEDTAVGRHLVSHAVVMALAGIPLLYLQSVFALGNRPHDEIVGQPARELHRAPVDAEAVRVGSSGRSPTARSLAGLRRMAELRSSSDAFDPSAPQRVHRLHPSVLAVERIGRRDGSALVTINLSDRAVAVELPAGRRWSVLDGGDDGDDAPVDTVELGAHQDRWWRELPG